MIKSFRSKGLQEIFGRGTSAKIDARLHRKIARQLDALDQASAPESMAVPGWDFHALKGFDPTRYTVHVNGPWCITFEFEDGNAYRVDFEQYH